MPRKTYQLITFGCQMNWSDSERIAAVMKKMKLKPASPQKADLIIFNLCSVRQTAVDRVWGTLEHYCHPEPRILRGEKSCGRRKKIIIMTGCVLPADKKKFAEKVDLILNINDLPRWPIAIAPLLFKEGVGGGYKIKTIKQSCSDYFSIIPNYNSKFSAFVPVMTGCDNFCSYCVVPYVRGREVSRPAEEIISEVNKLVVQGYRLIILLGQNVNSYASQISNFHPPVGGPISKQISKSKFQISKKTSHIDFPDLLKLLNSIRGNYWLSFITSHPKDMSEELINCFSNCRHLIPYLHLPLQSGSDKILKAMNRKYTAKKYLNLIRKTRRVISNICISTDIIVGFPNETKQDFQKTADLMKLLKFDMAYLAEYSPRFGTAAAKLKDNISPAEKHHRFQILNEILKKTVLGNNRKMVGKEAEVLVERVGTGLDLSVFGKTRNFKDVKIVISNHPPTSNREASRAGKSEISDLIGKIVKVKIIKAGSWNLEGKLTK